MDKTSASPLLPRGDELKDLLDLTWGQDIEDLVARSLLNPVHEFLQRPGKKIRGRFVEIGFKLAGPFSSSPLTPETQALIDKGAEVLEALHAGSLVVDDIQDGSFMRRGQPTLHRSHGVPVALNAGNWLYFWPFESVQSWGLIPEMEVKIYRLCHHTLLRAHFGQALDVGVPIDSLSQDRIPSVCLASLELKTGALMAMGISMGAILGSATDERLQTLDIFGHAFGVALQMFDDLGNLRNATHSPDPKQYEDLKLRRPSWVWAVAAGSYDARIFASFRNAVEQLPDDQALRAWVSEHQFLPVAKARAREHLETSLRLLSDALRSQGEYGEVVSMIYDLGERLTQSYE